jgi:squalene-hopene/tetraprenyl-beta-curcumene cyclase
MSSEPLKQAGVETATAPGSPARRCADSPSTSRLLAAREQAVTALLAERTAGGHWIGELSSSALSTATAVCALAIWGRNGGQATAEHWRLIDGGLRWLAAHANADGGWGDTDRSFSNISTTTLVWAAFGAAAGATTQYAAVMDRAEAWLARRAGGLAPESLAAAIAARYGKDRTFSVPILTMCALAGRFGAPGQAWRLVRQLPFELAALPHQLYGALRLPVVSYALPALIAIGQARHHFRPTRHPVVCWLRDRTRRRTLEILAAIQPSNGGFLEATPLTSFVTMSLAGMGLVEHPVTRRGVEFLVRSARPDGSWPIDTHLATWVTTLSVNALLPGTEPPEADRRQILDWLLRQQQRVEHPYTHAAPGGWAWTPLPGGVPDADDTAGALLALRALSPRPDAETARAAAAGIGWLVRLQNGDGGIPTFCRGWGALPFDRSSPDLTAHALRAWLAWREEVPAELKRRLATAVPRAVRYLAKTQRADGAWLPLWFGHQESPDDENPLYGTARVLAALAEAERAGMSGVRPVIERAASWLVNWQNADGGWSGARRAESSVEETALAVEALAAWPGPAGSAPAQAALERGVAWLLERVRDGRWRAASPIGFYFARLWYYERLYPMIFTVAALNRVANDRMAG